MNNKILYIQKAFKGKLVGNARMQRYVAEVLLKMPKDIVAFVTNSVWFVTSYDDAWAFTFTGNDFKNKHVIFLSDELLQEDKTQIYWTIAHEIGHVVLRHKNRFLEKFSKKKVKQQENEADIFAGQYIPKP